jgi:hypothetical protein
MEFRRVINVLSMFRLFTPPRLLPITLVTRHNNSLPLHPNFLTTTPTGLLHTDNTRVPLPERDLGFGDPP